MMMTRTNILTVSASLAVSFIAVIGGFAAIEPSDLKAALDRAIDDERHALALYKQVMEKHGERRPFSNIVFAERRHELALLAQYQRLGLAPPANEWADRSIEVPSTFREACDASVFAEIENIRLYDDVIAAVDDEQVRVVFRQLQRASAERHLPAFQRHSSGWRVLTEKPTATQQAQADRAAAARDDLFGVLSKRLTAEVGAHGPAQTITVCKDEAPVLAKEIAREHDVAIGRTSWKLRNPDNTGPGWLTLVLQDRPERVQLLADRSGRLGYVSPIRVASGCLACHGPRESIAPDVRDRLDALYPGDQATGFNEGDLRGWFWVEIPASSREDSLD